MAQTFSTRIGDTNSQSFRAPSAAISVRNLTVSYAAQVAHKEAEGSVAVDNVSFDVQPGEFVAIVGPSGCGKSTILKALANLITPSRGEVNVSHEERGRPRIGFVFQSDALLPWKTALKNVELAVRLAGEPNHVASVRATQLMTELGLGDSCHKYPAQLSGGMRKRVSLARALAHSPSVFLMDEPFGALDALTRIQVGNFCLDIFDRARQSVVFVTHDIDEAVAMSDRVLVMSDRPGRLIAEFKVDLPRPRDYHETRFVDGFTDLQQVVWKALTTGGRNVHSV